MNAVAATAIALKKALQPSFRVYAKKVIENAQALAETLINGGGDLITGGTDNHMMVLDTAKSFGIDGRVAEEALDAVSITTNRQIIPDDPRPPLRPSGIRIGTPAATTRGLEPDDLRKLGGWMLEALRHAEDASQLETLRNTVEAFCEGFPVPGIES